MLHTLHFYLQNAVYFIMLSFLVPALFTFYIQGVLKFKCKTQVPKVNVANYKTEQGNCSDMKLNTWPSSTLVQRAINFVDFSAHVAL
jgi:hypothetical protein